MDKNPIFSLTLFSAEAVARIISTGLLFDPESRVSTWVSEQKKGISRLLQRRAVAGTHLDSQEKATVRAAWRSTNTVKPPQRKTTALPEAPFQTAVQKQLKLSAAARPYLRHSWHRIDLLSIVCFWIAFCLTSARQEATISHHIYIFRALSILRAGRLLVITSGTATILDSLKRAAPLLITVAFFVIFASTLFSIIGVQSFRGSFRRTCILTDPLNASNIIDTGQQCGGFLDLSTLQDLPYLLRNGAAAPLAPKGYICPLDQICQVGAISAEICGRLHR